MAQSLPATTLARRRPWRFALERVGNALFVISALTVIAVMGLIYFFVGSQSWQTFFQTTLTRGPVSPGEFFFSTQWDAVTQLGTWYYIVGSFSLIVATLIIAVPISVGAAVFIVEYAPVRLRAPLRGIIELFLGIPSVIFGLIGLLFVVPRIRDILDFFAGGKDYNGYGLIPAAIVVTFMILPTIATISVDALNAVPREIRDGSLALGATRWQTVSRALIPAALPGITTGVILGIARALGETVAIAFVIGGAQHFPIGYDASNPFAPIYLGPTTALTVLLLFNFKEAGTNTGLYNALWTTSFLLLLFSAGLVAISRTLAARRVYQ